jgi:hypothetical protein
MISQSPSISILKFETHNDLISKTIEVFSKFHVLAPTSSLTLIPDEIIEEDARHAQPKP